MIKVIETGEFWNLDKDRGMGVFMVSTTRRVQYRMGGPKGQLLASGMTPSEFAKRFWFRDDVEG